MRKLIIFTAVLAVAAFGRQAHVYVGDGTETPDTWDQTTGDVYIAGDLEVDTVCDLDGAVDMSGDVDLDNVDIDGDLTLPDGVVGNPAWEFESDPDNGPYLGAADAIWWAINGANVGTFTATGINVFDIGQTTPGEGDFTTGSFTGDVDFSAGLVGQPSITTTGDLDHGWWFSAADTMNYSAGGVEQLEIDAVSLDIVPDTNITGGLDVDGDTDLDIVDIDGALTLPDGLVTAPSWQIESDLQSGPYLNGADVIGWAIAGVNEMDITATGLDVVDDVDVTGDVNVTTDLDVDGDTDLDDVTIAGLTDLFVGAVGAPSVYYTGSATTGYYQTAGDELGVTVLGGQVGRWDGTGLIGVGFNGPIGTTTPAAGTFTDVDVGDDFNFGQDIGDLVTGYKERGDCITFQDDFTVGVDAQYAIVWDLTTVVGGGTNTVTVRDGWAEIVTGGAGVDSNSVRSWGLTNDRAFAPRMESVVDLTNLVTQRFEWGFWAAANEYVLIVYDVSIDPNWLLVVDDTGGAETINSTVPVTVDPTKLEIRVSAAGEVTWALDDVAMTVVGLTNPMSANPHYTWWELTDQAAAPHTVAVDYVQIEQLKQQ